MTIACDERASAPFRELAAQPYTAPQRTEVAALLEVRDLRIEIDLRGRRVSAVNGVSFELFPGRTLAIVGESGAGKSLTCRALMGLLPKAAVMTGSIRLRGKELVGLTEAQLCRHRGSDISMVLQDTDRSLNPTMQVGRQITEAMRVHRSIDRRSARERAISLLESLNLPDAVRVFCAYPHQLSGGMRQRVMIAIALACEPRLLIMDEATRSLDVTTQAEVMTLVSLLQSRNEMAIVMVSHDLRLVSRFADDVLVTRDGRTVERAPPHTLISAPRMPYTKALLDAVPSLEAPGRRSDAVGRRSCEAHGDLVLAHSRPEVFGPKPATAPAPRPSSGATGLVAMHAAKRKSPSSAVSASIRADTPLLEVRNLTHEFPVRGPGLHGRSAQRVVSNVSFELRPAETMGLAGESGSGKSTLARAIVQLPRPTSGSVVFNDCELTQLRGGELRQARRRIQMVFQEPLASLDPKWRVSDIVEEPLLGYGVRSSSERRNRVDAILERVGLPPGIYGGRRPRQLSGGQCQRVAIARALALEPDLLICDEVVSSLDALVQAQILDLLARLRAELGLSCLFISHDLAVLRQLSDRIAVLHSGQLCEIGATESLYRTPAHPYTSVLLASATIHKGDVAARGSPARASTICPPSPGPQHGCRFRDNCRSAQPKCAVEQPSLKKIGADHWVACHFPMTTEAEPKLTASGGRR